jgi:threonine dehydrogenase-like Zn-dependent dehydrogenase
MKILLVYSDFIRISKQGKHHFKPNTVLGHEFCGEVVAIGTHVRHVKLGDRVAIDNNIRCGFCSFCRMGLSSQCVEIKTSALGVMRDGATPSTAWCRKTVLCAAPYGRD